MLRIASTFPLSYSESLQTARSAECTALRTRSGSISLTDFLKNDASLLALNIVFSADHLELSTDSTISVLSDLVGLLLKVKLDFGNVNSCQYRKPILPCLKVGVSGIFHDTIS